MMMVAMMMVMMMMTTAPHTHDDSIHLIESRRYADDDDDDDDDDGNDDNDGVDRGISQFHSTLMNYEYRRWLSALLPMRTGITNSHWGTTNICDGCTPHARLPTRTDSSTHAAR